MDAPMHVALAANEPYFPGLACAIFSIASATDNHRGIVFHVMDGGIDDVSWNFLEQKVSGLSREIHLQRHRISMSTFEGFPPDWGGGAMTYARLLMQSIIEEDEVIYVDSDILCFRNLRELWEEPMESNLIAACQDRNIKVLGNDSVFELNEEEAQQWYFNAGFMKVNLRMWRQEHIQSKAMALLREFGTKCTWWDQTALNAICQGKVKYLNRGWNRFCVERFTLQDFTEDMINIHYVSRAKPWQTYDSKCISNVVWRLHRERWMPDFIMPRNWLGHIRKSCYDVAVFLVNGCGKVLIGTIDAVRACLACLSWNAKLQALSHWLERRRVGIEIVQWAWKRTSSLNLPEGEARQCYDENRRQ